MVEKVKISHRQLTILFLLITIGDSILILPSIPANEAHQDAWISGILSLLLGLVICYLYYAVGKLYPQLTLIEYTNVIFGKIGWFISLLFIIYPLLSLAALLREIGDFMATQIFVETPMEAIIILMLLVVIMAVRLGLECIARSAEIFFPFLILLFIVMVVCLLPQIKLDNVYPVLEHGIHPILRGSISFTALPFMETFVILMILPYVNKKAGIKRSLLIGGGIGGTVLLIMTGLSLLVLDPNLTAKSVYPSYKLASKINLADMIQRVEAVLAAIWFITIFFKMALYLYAASLGTAQLLKLNNYQFLLLPFGMITIPLALTLGENSMYLSYIFMKIWPFYDLTHAVIFPTLLLIIGTYKKKMEAKLSL
ncbi:endospore germination permease [Fictibacillus sp. WQ 8-8]|uniref:GerAB/ArcD/ProY family transporter n=1 Tax=Fictibacillus sp. WQ 8-8 TaxID=2938788 RepID=UPI002108E9B7|nr:endospore germination permease [Fictibacillus sp. WQ 8-8]MCQ6268682.1 endospore germination permease [Fictibacillus sp. WQ 8-8]